MGIALGSFFPPSSPSSSSPPTTTRSRDPHQHRRDEMRKKGALWTGFSAASVGKVRLGWSVGRGLNTRILRDEEERRAMKQIEQDCRTLGLSENCDEGEVRSAYIKLAKKFHPDGRGEFADAAMFQKVDTAYKNLLKAFAEFRHNLHKTEGEYGLYYEEKKEEEESPDIKHTAPQHRQYLTFDGVGSGNHFEREKQYNKYRQVKASENVMEYRIQKLSQTWSEQEKTLVKDSKASRKTKTGIGIDRLVEDLIQESMAKGVFDNLSGKGKPLKHSSSYNPYIDFTTHKLNQVLVDNGFAPGWIILEKEIREEIKRLRQNILLIRHQYDAVLTNEELVQLENKAIKDLTPDCDKLNKMIFNFNLTVPSLNKQMINFQLDKELKKTLATFSPEMHKAAVNENCRMKEKENSQRSSPLNTGVDVSFIGMLMSIFK